jgi:hypothetical protein
MLLNLITLALVISVILTQLRFFYQQRENAKKLANLLANKSIVSDIEQIFMDTPTDFIPKVCDKYNLSLDTSIKLYEIIKHK